MMYYIKFFLKKLTTSQQRVYWKKKKRHVQSFFYKRKSKTTLKELRSYLVDILQLQAGDKIIVASSFGSLNAQYSPKDVIELLQDIVTADGTIMMPYYPPINSDEWAKGNYVFNMQATQSGMGVLTNVFSKMPGVYKSIHPTKAVCVWGKNAEMIVEGHNNSTTPFYWDSPYGKFLKMGCKSLGLGLKNIPIFHTFEDVLSSNKYEYYLPEIVTLRVKLISGEEILVSTCIHNADVLDHCVSAGDFVASLHCKTYKKVEYGLSFLYVIDNTDLYNQVKLSFEKGITRRRK